MSGILNGTTRTLDWSPHNFDRTVLRKQDFHCISEKLMDWRIDDFGHLKEGVDVCNARLYFNNFASAYATIPFFDAMFESVFAAEKFSNSVIKILLFY